MTITCKAAWKRGALALIGLLAALPATAQSPLQGPKLSVVTVMPAPGTYTNTTSIVLDDADKTAEVHYTWDGSVPTASSPRIERGQVLFIAGVYDGNKGLTTGYTLRAVATKAGYADSDPVTFSYTVARRDRTAYVSEEILSGVRMIRDSDNDKMFLIKGEKAYALIDSGMGRGDLKAYISQFVGGFPIIPIFTHSHGDHIGQADQFVADADMYIGAPDWPATAAFLEGKGVPASTIAAHLKKLDDGDTIDLGHRELQIYTVAGHTPGTIVIFDPASGALFSGDALGNNSYLPPDILFMQFDPRPLDAYLANLRTLREKIGNRITHILTGHNDRPLLGTTYLDNLDTAIQRLIDKGDAALIPSWRPPGIWQIVIGDRYSDPNWIGVNVARETYLPAKPDQIAGLTEVKLTGAHLTQNLDPDVHTLTARLDRPGAAVTVAATPTSTRSRRLTIAGVVAAPDKPVTLSSTAKPVVIAVTAPDGITAATYTLSFQTLH